MLSLIFKFRLAHVQRALAEAFSAAPRLGAELVRKAIEMQSTEVCLPSKSVS